MKTRIAIAAAASLVAAGSIAARVSAQAIAAPAAAAKVGAAVTNPGDGDGAFVEPWRFSEPDGAHMFKRVCAGCHMPDAMGAKGAGHYPALAKNPKLEAAGYPVMVVLHGLNGMPHFDQMMTDQQIADVVNHVRTHFGNRYRDAVTAADVKAAR